LSLVVSVAAWEADISPAEKFVLLAIAECSGGGEESIWRRNDRYIARLTGLPVEVVEDAVGDLIARQTLIETRADPVGPGDSYVVSPWNLPGVAIHQQLAPTPERTAEPPPKKDPGFVYVVRGGGYHKIGKAKDLDARVKWFELKLPFEIEVVLVIPSNYYSALERELHTTFEHKRVNGEWFQLTDEDVEDMRQQYGSRGQSESP
jgi:hypothetical protein